MPDIAPPSYETLTTELDRLISTLNDIKSAGRDTGGDLTDPLKAQIADALLKLAAAKVLFTCVQDHAAYGPRP